MCLLYLIILLQLFATTGASYSGIVGGREAEKHSRPYMVSLQHRNAHCCGGILIRKDFVLTSGHCLMHYPLVAILGAHNLFITKAQQRINVSKYYRHPLHLKFNQTRYDIMLLKLKTKAKIDEMVDVIGLPKKNEQIPEKTKCSVAGWGMTKSNTASVNVLMEANVTAGSYDPCKRVWTRKYFDPKQMLCTPTGKGKGFCQGDSGGPLVCNTRAQGIVAYNYQGDCEGTAFPQVYMKISFFLPWIKEVLDG